MAVVTVEGTPVRRHEITSSFAFFRSSRLLPLSLMLALALTGLSAPIDGSSAFASEDCDRPSWVVSWLMPQSVLGPEASNETVRVVAPVSLGGEALRVRISNELGTDPLVVGAASAAESTGGSALLPATLRPLTFNGEPHLTVQPGAVVVSDPVALALPDNAHVAVNLYLPDSQVTGSGHSSTAAHMWKAAGDRTTDESDVDFYDFGQGAYWFTALDVLTVNDGAVVAFGDSITEGSALSELALGEMVAWPDRLFERLLERSADGGPRLAVVNSGLSGNRVLRPNTGPSGVDRFVRDGVGHTGVRSVLVMEGINDLSPTLRYETDIPSARALADGYDAMVATGRDHGAEVWLSPMTAGGDLLRPSPFLSSNTPEQVERRHEVNALIRTRSGAYTPGFDFEPVVADPANPNWLAPGYDSGDNLHPNQAGQTAMADSIDLRLFDHLACGAEPSGPANGCDTPAWLGAWATAMAMPSALPGFGVTPTPFIDQTIRQTMIPAASGDQVRLRLSNRFGHTPVEVDSVRIAVAADGAAIVDGTSTAVTFGGLDSVAIPAGGTVTSDPVPFPVANAVPLAVSLHVPGPAVVDTHPEAFQTTWMSGPAQGRHSDDVDGGAFTQTSTSLYVVDAIDVRSATTGAAVVALGDSITDGSGSTLDAHQRWPDELNRRVATEHPDIDLRVLNVGIGANQVSTDTPTFGPAARNRVEEDVLTRTGATDLFVLEGINDINLFGNPAETPAAAAQRVIDGYSEIIDIAKAEGLRVHGATLTPAGVSGDKEAARNAINEWIRTSGAFDVVVDFDAALRDPGDPTRMRPEYDSGDGLHPGDAGYDAMADTIDLNAFLGATCGGRLSVAS